MKRNDYLEKELEKFRSREPISANPDVLQAYLETMENGNLFLTIHNFNGCNRNVLPYYRIGKLIRLKVEDFREGIEKWTKVEE